jgi:hypothetical protein
LDLWICSINTNMQRGHELGHQHAQVEKYLLHIHVHAACPSTYCEGSTRFLALS